MTPAAQRLVNLLERASAALGDPDDVGAPNDRHRLMDRRASLDGARRTVYARDRRLGDLRAKLAVLAAEVRSWDAMADRLRARLEEARQAPTGDDWATKRQNLMVEERLVESLALLETGWGRTTGVAFLPDPFSQVFNECFPGGHPGRHTSPAAVRARLVTLEAEVEEAAADLANAVAAGEAMLLAGEAAAAA